MKFGKYFECYRIPKWVNYYIDYEGLKQNIIRIKKILQYREGHEISEFTNISESSADEEDEINFKKFSFHNKTTFVKFKNNPNNVEEDPVFSSLKENLLDEESLCNQWIQDYLNSVDLVNRFYLNKIEKISEKLQKYKKNLSELIQKDEGVIKSNIKITFHGTKDELEKAISWNNEYSKILVNLRYLDLFCQINLIATRKIVKKFIKVVNPSNKELSLKLTSYPHTKEFAQHQKVMSVKNRLLEDYSNVFCGGDRQIAIKMLQSDSSEARPKDLIVSSLFMGISISLLSLLLLVIIIPRTVEENSSNIFNMLPVFRLTFIPIFLISSCAIVIHFFRYFKVNYIYIFQLDPEYRIREAQLIKCSLILFSIWLISLILQLTIMKHDILGIHSSLFPLILFCLFGFLLISPFQLFYRKARKELIFTIWNILIAPIGVVRFKDFFLADIFCSLVKPFQDLIFSICFFTSSIAWINNIYSTCKYNLIAIPLVAILPFYWRFMQCIRKYYDTNDSFPHLVNAGKYMTSMIVGFIGLVAAVLAVDTRHYYILFSIMATIYSYVWDITMDWGLMRDFANNYFLRPKILYPKYYYYFAIISNLILRFTWILTLYTANLMNQSVGWTFLIVSILTFCEAYRRSQWSLFRVENENVNNFEKYRSILEVPQLPEEEEYH